MRLEVISRHPKGLGRPIPLLFVHGANSGAWVWEEHFLPYFARNGYEAHAVSLRGHGRSEGRDTLPLAGLADYVADVHDTVLGLGKLPVLIGHSMGGMVVQKYLQRHEAAGAVLMASLPPEGLLMTSIDMFLRDPILFQQICWLQVIGPFMPQAYPLVRRILFSPHMPEDKVRAYFHRWQPESSCVVFDMLGFDLPRSHVNGLPILVQGAENDVFVPPNVVEAMARHFGCAATVFPNMAHAMMLEPDWEVAAEHLLGWLETAVMPELAVAA